MGVMCQTAVPGHRHPCSSCASSQVLGSVLGPMANLEQRGRVSHTVHRLALSHLPFDAGVISEDFFDDMSSSRKNIVESIQNNFCAIRGKGLFI